MVANLEAALAQGGIAGGFVRFEMIDQYAVQTCIGAAIAGDEIGEAGRLAKAADALLSAVRKRRRAWLPLALRQQPWAARGEFTGKRTPPLPKQPDLSKVKFGAPIPLFNGKDLTGWRPHESDKINGWSVRDGVMVNTTRRRDTKSLRT